MKPTVFCTSKCICVQSLMETSGWAALFPIPLWAYCFLPSNGACKRKRFKVNDEERFPDLTLIKKETSGKIKYSQKLRHVEVHVLLIERKEQLSHVFNFKSTQRVNWGRMHGRTAAEEEVTESSLQSHSPATLLRLKERAGAPPLRSMYRGSTCCLGRGFWKMNGVERRLFVYGSNSRDKETTATWMAVKWMCWMSDGALFSNGACEGGRLYAFVFRPLNAEQRPSCLSGLTVKMLMVPLLGEKIHQGKNSERGVPSVLLVILALTAKTPEGDWNDQS